MFCGNEIELMDDNLTVVRVEFDRPIGVTVSNDGVIFATEWGRSHRIVIQ